VGALTVLGQTSDGSIRLLPGNYPPSTIGGSGGLNLDTYNSDVVIMGYGGINAVVISCELINGIIANQQQVVENIVFSNGLGIFSFGGESKLIGCAFLSFFSSMYRC